MIAKSGESTAAAPRWACPGAHTRTLYLGNTRMGWIEVGEGAPLLLLHGYGGSARWWTRNLQSLAREHRVYALDLPGFGRSATRAGFTLNGVVEQVAAWMEAMSIDRAQVMGHSMGGLIALLLAARYPERVQAQLLCAPAGIPFSACLPVIALRALRSRGNGDQRFTPIVLGGSLRAGPRVLWRAVQEIRGMDIVPVLTTVTAPTLILWGARDALLPVDGGPLIAAAIPGARLIVVPGAGHNLMYEQAELVNQAAHDFFNSM